MLEARFRPLDRWPRKRTPSYSQRRSTFRARYSDTLDLLEKELGYLKAKNVVIEADFKLADIRNDGWPKSSARPKSSAVIVSFESKHGPLSLPCDRFDAWEDNLRAIAFHLHYLRKSDLYGVTVSGEQYKGWAALPPEGGTGMTTAQDAAEFIARHSGYQVTMILSGQALDPAYKAAAFKLHPDRGGDTHLFQQLQTALGIVRDAQGGIR